MVTRGQLLAGVIAGTPFDTDLGSNFLQRLGWQVIPFAAGRNPEEQDFLQGQHPEMLQQLIMQQALNLQARGVQFVLLYCNSLSSVLDLDYLQQNLRVPLITPFDTYKDLALHYRRYAVIAANAVGLRGVERTFKRYNTSAFILGYHNIDLVRAIESRIEASDLIASSSLASFIELALAGNTEVIVLACTHFPCLTKDLAAMTSLPVFNIDQGLARAIDAKIRYSNMGRGLDITE